MDIIALLQNNIITIIGFSIIILFLFVTRKNNRDPVLINQDQIQILEKQHNDSLIQLSIEKNTIQELNKQIHELKTKIDSLDQKEKELRESNASLKQEVYGLNEKQQALKKLEGQQEEQKISNDKLTIENASLKEQIKNLNEKQEALKKLEGQQEEQKTSNDKLTIENTSLKEQIKNLNENYKNKEIEVNNLNNALKKNQQEVTDHISKLSQSEKTLEDEKIRLRKEDEQRQKEEEANRTRIWNEHEKYSLKQMKSICDKEGVNLKYFDNDNLPNDFGTKFKPDFLVELVEQYVIFDAKISKADNINTYIADQVKKTVKKIKENKKEDIIFKSIFLIIPTIDIHKVEKFSYYEDGFYIYIISIESFEPIIVNLKKIEEYKIADDITPQDRENIVKVVSSLAYHIHYQNAHNIVLTSKGLSTIEGLKDLKTDIHDKIELTMKQNRLESVKTTDLKDLLSSKKQKEKIMTFLPEQNS